MKELYLEHIILTNFRNYTNAHVHFCRDLNCLVGKNGMGKTNLLDAIYYLCMTKSRLNGLDKYVMHHDESFLRLESTFLKDDSQQHIVIKSHKMQAKVIEKNRVPLQKSAEHIGFLPVVMIMPDDTDVIKGGSEERRRFVDNTMSQIDVQYLNALIKCNKLLKQRNALLKQEGQHVNIELLRTYDEQMLAPTNYIYQKRKEFIHQFIPYFQYYYKEISKEAEEVNIEYHSQLSTNSFKELMNQNLQKDIILQRTNGGVHKDDLIFELESHKMKRFASQGQLKSFVLALGLARFMMLKEALSVYPILLLDDIFDKLDRNRINQLLTLLSSSNFGQIFITDTQEKRVREIIEYFKKETFIFEIDTAQVKKI